MYVTGYNCMAFMVFIKNINLVKIIGNYFKLIIKMNLLNKKQIKCIAASCVCVFAINNKVLQLIPPVATVEWCL